MNDYKETDDLIMDDLISALHNGRLNSWEAGFVESIHEQWEDKGRLTDAQLDKARDIWLKI